MKYIKILLLLTVLFVSITVSANISLRDQVRAMPSGEVLLEKISIGVEKIVSKIEQDVAFGDAIQTRIDEIVQQYSTKTDQKSKNIVIIMQYLESQIDGKIKVASTRVLQRLEKIKTEKYKKISSNRVNQLKKKRYDRISIKK